jgi:hypothetical protein
MSNPGEFTGAIKSGGFRMTGLSSPAAKQIKSAIYVQFISATTANFHHLTL